MGRHGSEGSVLGLASHLPLGCSYATVELTGWCFWSEDWQGRRVTQRSVVLYVQQAFFKQRYSSHR